MTGFGMRRWCGVLAIAAGLGAGDPSAHASRRSTDGQPTVRVLTPPDFWGAWAIWGATGNDLRGHVWVGITSNDDRGSGSAHLYELDPDVGSINDRGNVVQELERLHLRRPGETQMKIHSRIVEAADGRLYFTSMDESGEKDDGSRLPTWGGHLWRLSRRGVWQHLAAVPQALIAAAVGGPYVYTLGYFNHVLFQFDTRSGRMASVTVGSVGGHVSRNIFADRRGHAYRTARPAQRGSARGLAGRTGRGPARGRRDPTGRVFRAQSRRIARRCRHPAGWGRRVVLHYGQGPAVSRAAAAIRPVTRER